MKSDTDLTFDGGGRGKKPNQKLKPYFVMQYLYLLEATDQNHFVSAKNIAEHLKAFYEIDAEVRSVYRDIKEINKAMLMVEEKIDI